MFTSISIRKMKVDSRSGSWDNRQRYHREKVVPELRGKERYRA